MHRTLAFFAIASVTISCRTSNVQMESGTLAEELVVDLKVSATSGSAKNKKLATLLYESLDAYMRVPNNQDTMGLSADDEGVITLKGSGNTIVCSRKHCTIKWTKNPTPKGGRSGYAGVLFLGKRLFTGAPVSIDGNAQPEFPVVIGHPQGNRIECVDNAAQDLNSQFMCKFYKEGENEEPGAQTPSPTPRKGFRCALDELYDGSLFEESFGTGPENSDLAYTTGSAGNDHELDIGDSNYKQDDDGCKFKVSGTPAKRKIEINCRDVVFLKLQRNGAKAELFSRKTANGTWGSAADLKGCADIDE